MNTTKRPSLWDDAIRRLSKEDRDILNLEDNEKRDIIPEILKLAEEKRDTYQSKQWHFRLGKKKVCVREVFDKVLDFVKKVKVIGDVAIQYDTGHVALPWAGFRLILLIVTADSENLGSILLGLEIISRGIGRCQLLEQGLPTSDDPILGGTTTGLRESIERFYDNSFDYLVTVIRFFGRNASVNFIGGFFNTLDIEKRLETVNRAEEEVIKYMGNLELKFSKEHKSTFSDFLQVYGDTFLFMEERFNDLAKPLSRIEESLIDREQREILEWLSDLSYRAEHELASDGRLIGTGQWLLEKPETAAWSNDASSSILFLHGAPGFGKTKLASLMVDTLRKGLQDDVIAYYYCREDRNQQPVDIYRALARQLAFIPKTRSGIHPLVLQKYRELKAKGSMDDGGEFSLSKFMAKKLLSTLLGEYSETYICLDALDECEPKCRVEILEFIREVTTNTSRPVKIFLSSRDTYNHRIVSSLDHCTNIYIRAEDNRKDIRALVDYNLQNKHFLFGELSDAFKEEINTTLMEKSGGMFLWVVLRLQSLLDQDFEAIVRDQLHTSALPDTLDDEYHRIIDRIKDQEAITPSIAISVFRWLIAAKQTLTKDELLSALSLELNRYRPKNDGEVPAVSEMQVLKICQNLVILDRHSNPQRFRFAHLSVKEYLLKQVEEASEMESALFVTKYCAFAYGDNETLNFRICNQLLTSRKYQRPADYRNAIEAKGLPAIFTYIIRYWEPHLRTYPDKADPKYSQIGEILHISKRFRFYLSHLMDSSNEQYAQAKVLDGMRYSGTGDLYQILQILLGCAPNKNILQQLASLATNGRFDRDRFSERCARLVTIGIIHGICETLVDPKRVEHISMTLAPRLLDFYPNSALIECKLPIFRDFDRERPVHNTTLLVALCSSGLLGNYLRLGSKNTLHLLPRRFELIHRTIAYGADLSTRFTSDGTASPLHIFLGSCKRWANLDDAKCVVRHMIHAGADIMATDGAGRTAVDRVDQRNVPLWTFAQSLVDDRIKVEIAATMACLLLGYSAIFYALYVS